MTFEKWFDTSYPEGSIVPDEARELCKSICKEAWSVSIDIGWQNGYNQGYCIAMGDFNPE